MQMMNYKHEIAMIHGRFQPFHLGHLTYALLAKARCEALVVGITNPDRRHLKTMEGDATRHLPEANPFTYYQRMQMAKMSLIAAGLDPSALTIVPFPIEAPDLWDAYCPSGITTFLRDRGSWTKTKISLFQQKGWPCEVLVDTENLNIEGRVIRSLLFAGDQRWRDLVPSATAGIIDESGIAGNKL